MVRSPSLSSKKLNLGLWRDSSHFLKQYRWTDGTRILHSSTAQIRLLQVHGQGGPHGALEKWARQLSRPIPFDVWEATWLRYRSAAENTFLWQLLYRIPATNTWRFPGRPATDAETWCTRCPLSIPEDAFHCVWSCAVSRPCWEWCSRILTWCSTQRMHMVRLSPAHVFIAEALPREWETPLSLWHTMRAILCWVIWKERNNEVFTGERSSTQRMIGIAWARLALYIKSAWHDLLTRVRARKITLLEASDRMADQFGSSGKIWSLQNIQVLIPPVPPCPP